IRPRSKRCGRDCSKRFVDRELPAVEALVIDDTGFPKKGKFSVGVARQYSGTLGRVDNCQVAVSVHLAGETGSACIGVRLFVPEAWARDAARRRSVGIPAEIEYQKKWQIALALGRRSARRGCSSSCGARRSWL